VEDAINQMYGILQSGEGKSLANKSAIICRWKFSYRVIIAGGGY
jgi:hypothetical protein